MLDSEFWAVLKALIGYYLALIARSKITDFEGHNTADYSVQEAERKLTAALVDLKFADRHAYDAERRVIFGTPLEELDDIPF
jgi:hypothetical protein